VAEAIAKSSSCGISPKNANRHGDGLSRFTTLAHLIKCLSAGYGNGGTALYPTSRPKSADGPCKRWFARPKPSAEALKAALWATMASD